MCMIDLNECQCSCHTTPGMMHVVACCSRCPKCGKNIAYGFKEHKEQCNAGSIYGGSYENYQELSEMWDRL